MLVPETYGLTPWAVPTEILAGQTSIHSKPNLTRSSSFRVQWKPSLLRPLNNHRRSRTWSVQTTEGTAHWKVEEAHNPRRMLSPLKHTHGENFEEPRSPWWRNQSDDCFAAKMIMVNVKVFSTGRWETKQPTALRGNTQVWFLR